MDENDHFVEDNNLNEGLSYLTISTNGSNTNNTSHNNLNTNTSNNEDDDVMFMGTSITVKTEKINNDSVENVDKNSSSTDSDNKENKSCWLISRIKGTPKAHFVKNLKEIKKEKYLGGFNTSGKEELINLKDVTNLKRGKKSKSNSQCSTISNNTSYTFNSNWGKNMKRNKNKDSVLKEYSGPYTNMYFPNYPYYPLPYAYNPLYSNFNNEVIYNHDEGEKARWWSKITPEYINKWIKTIFNVVMLLFLLYISLVIIFIIKNDIANHIQRNVIKLNNESILCMNEYKRNKCGVLNIPAMENKCKEWEKCMKKKDLNIYKDISLVSVEFIGSLINKLINQLDIKSLLFIVLIIVLLMFMIKYNGSKMSYPLHYPFYKSNRKENEEFVNNKKNGILNKYYVPNYLSRSKYPFVK